MLSCNQIHMRDPFVLPVASQQKYYLYGTTDVNCWSGTAQGFNAFKSDDLINWEGPFPAFRPPADFWANENFWAPEVYAVKGRFFMAASFYIKGRCRGTQLLSADSPIGPFIPHSPAPLTPSTWECLDGTLYFENDTPYLIFCHEWVQVGDGTICSQRLSDDLRSAVGEPVELFSASQAPWPTQLKLIVENGKYVAVMKKMKVPLDLEENKYFVTSPKFVTDGPFMYRSKSSALFMSWSSIRSGTYAIGLAVSPSGALAGPWKHRKTPLVDIDGGHGMLFKKFDGQLCLTIHYPNESPNERPIFLNCTDTGDDLIVEK